MSAPRSTRRRGRNASFELSGPLSVSAIEAFNLDLAIIGVDGMDVRGGLTTYDHAEAMTNAALVRRSAKTIVVTDSSKLGRACFARICDIEAVDELITEDAATDEQIAELSAIGVSVTRV